MFGSRRLEIIRGAWGVQLIVLSLGESCDALVVVQWRFSSSRKVMMLEPHN